MNLRHSKANWKLCVEWGWPLMALTSGDQATNLWPSCRTLRCECLLLGWPVSLDQSLHISYQVVGTRLLVPPFLEQK